MKLTATIRPTETKTITGEANDYATAKAQIEAQVPEGWLILQIPQYAITPVAERKGTKNESARSTP